MAYDPHEALRSLESRLASGDLTQARFDKAAAYHREMIARQERRAAGLPPSDAEKRDSRRNTLLMIGVGAVVILGLTWCQSIGSGGGAGGPLRESEAEVACERAVSNELNGGDFKQGANWEISGGWQINGTVNQDGASLGYSCKVAGASGSHRVSDVTIG